MTGLRANVSSLQTPAPSAGLWVETRGWIPGALLTPLVYPGAASQPTRTVSTLTSTTSITGEDLKLIPYKQCKSFGNININEVGDETPLHS